MIQYPHVEARVLPPNSLGKYVDQLWTECLSGQEYVLRFHRYNLSQSAIDSVYYPVVVGAPAQSAYCTLRDGFITNSFGPNSDYADTLLRYNLTYLDAGCRYRIRVIVYHDGSGSWQERFSLEDSTLGTVTAVGGTPETTWFDVPTHFYRDGEMVLKVRRLSGAQAILSGLQLRQFDDLSSGEGGEQAARIVPVATPPSLFLDGPNPLTVTTGIRYMLPTASRVSVRIIDVSGRSVRTLLSGQAGIQEPGVHSLVWNARNDRGQPLPSGVYICRLVTDRHSVCSKLVLSR